MSAAPQRLLPWRWGALSALICAAAAGRGLEARAASASAEGAEAQATTTDTLLAFWPGGEARLSDVLSIRSARWPALAGLTTGTLTAREWVEQAVLFKRLAQIAEERGYASRPEFLAYQQRFLDQQFFTRAYTAEILSVPRPTAEEIAAAYEERKESYSAPERVTFRYIYFDTSDLDPKAMEAKRAQAQSVLAQARQGADFAGLARQFSELGVDNKGRVFGPVARGLLWPEVEEALFSLGPGQISPAIETATGLHVVKVAARRAARQPPALADVYESLGDELLLERRAQRRGELLAELPQRFPVWVDEALLESPQGALRARGGETAIRVGPWSMTFSEAFEAAVEAEIIAADPRALKAFVEDLVERRLFILRGQELDEGRPRGRETPSWWRDMMLRLFALDQLAREQVTVSDAEIDAYYLRHLSQYAKAEALQARHIQISASGPEDPQAGSTPPSAVREAAGEIAAALSQGRTPEEEARRCAERGIRVAVGPEFTLWLEGQARAYRRKVEPVQAGQASEPIFWPPGWLVVQVLSRSPGGHWPVEEVRPLARLALEKEKLREARAKTRGELVGAATYSETVSSLDLGEG